MHSITPSDIVIGVDTHKDNHVAYACDGLGRRIDDIEIPATPDGYHALLAWAVVFGRVHTFGVEGTGSYGSGLAKFLRRHSYHVIEVSRPPRKGERRLSGKSDVIDAEHAAREVLTGTLETVPKTADGAVEAIRLVKIVRDTAVKAHSAAMITLKAVIVTGSDELRAELEHLTDHKLVTACAAMTAPETISGPADAMAHTLGHLARRWLELHEEIKAHTKTLKVLTTQTAPALLEAFGVGFDTAAEILVTAGDNSDRIRSDAAFAKLCGVCPIPASSGKTNRHRLNRGGNRQANAALYRTVIVRMHWHPETIAYVERRTKEGLTKKDIIRCLKRYVARELFNLLPPPTNQPTQHPLAA
jgi:transposase